MLAKIGLAVLSILILAAGFIAMQPAAYTLSRSTQISAPPAEVYALINDFHRWEDWSPWAKLDPAMKTTYSGPAAGAGSVYHWESNKDDVGEGRMTILETVPAERVVINLEFIKPFADTAHTEFRIRPDSGGSTVDWIMSGNHNFMTKAVMFAMGGMDKAVGPDFEKGLAQMKVAAEKN